jgi:hypothetical protein
VLIECDNAAAVLFDDDSAPSHAHCCGSAVPPCDTASPAGNGEASATRTLPPWSGTALSSARDTNSTPEPPTSDPVAGEKSGHGRFIAG